MVEASTAAFRRVEATECHNPMKVSEMRKLQLWPSEYISARCELNMALGCDEGEQNRLKAVGLASNLEHRNRALCLAMALTILIRLNEEACLTALGTTSWQAHSTIYARAWWALV